MDCVVLDLEWNQASDSRDARKQTAFEIVEIGAVKIKQPDGKWGYTLRS